MQRSIHSFTRSLLMFGVVLAAIASAAVAAPEKVKPSITITKVPSRASLPPGPDGIGVIMGETKGVTAATAKVVIFAKGGETYYVQPLVGASDTEIDKDGAWKSDTHGGMLYVALLCKRSYSPPASTGSLPAVGGEILAVARATPK